MSSNSSSSSNGGSSNGKNKRLASVVRGYVVSAGPTKKPRRNSDSLTSSLASESTYRSDIPPKGKIRTLLREQTFTGGDFVLDSEGRAATCSFCFEKDGKSYGVTNGHLADMGDSVFAIYDVEKSRYGRAEETYQLMEIGEVVSKDVETDTLVFAITHPWMRGRVCMLQLAPGSDISDGKHPDGIRVPKPNLILPSPTATYHPPKKHSKVFMYCASSRRVAVGFVAVPHNDAKGFASKIGDVGVCDIRGPYLPFESLGGQGSLFLSENGIPFAIQHACRSEGEYNDLHVSFGVPLTKVMAQHTLLGGNPALEIARRLSASTKAEKRVFCGETRDLRRFQVTNSQRNVPGIGTTKVDSSLPLEWDPSKDLPFEEVHFSNGEEIEEGEISDTERCVSN